MDATSRASLAGQLKLAGNMILMIRRMSEDGANLDDPASALQAAALCATYGAAALECAGELLIAASVAKGSPSAAICRLQNTRSSTASTAPMATHSDGRVCAAATSE
jgi:hypothetical protein